MSTDPRARLAEMQARLDKLDDVNSADIGLQMSVHYAVDTMLREDLPALVAAIGAVMDELSSMQAESRVAHGESNRPGSSGVEKVALGSVGHVLAQSADRINTAIADALGGDLG